MQSDRKCIEAQVESELCKNYLNLFKRCVVRLVHTHTLTVSQSGHQRLSERGFTQGAKTYKFREIKN